MSLHRGKNSILQIAIIRKIWVHIRLFINVSVLKKLLTIDSKGAFSSTVSHNLKGLRQCNNRMDLLIKPFSVIELINTESTVLIIGPRNENDIYSLAAQSDVKIQNIKGLDLISYSKKIELGDMHSTNYEKNYWDAVLCGWTLSYSFQPKEFANELIRIVKNGGLIGISVEYGNVSNYGSQELLGYSIQEFDKLEKRINSVPEILELFEGHVDEVYFSHDAPEKRAHSNNSFHKNVSNIAVIFRVSK